MTQNKKNRLGVLEKLMKSRKLDMILVFGTLQKFGELQYFTGLRPTYYHYFFVKPGKPLHSGYFAPYFLVREVKNIRNLVTFDDLDIPAEMNKLLHGKKRVGLIGSAPAFHFSESEAEIVFLDDEIRIEMAVKNSLEITKIRSVSNMLAAIVKAVSRKVKCGVAISKIAEAMEKMVGDKGAGLAFPPIVHNTKHHPNMFNWLSPTEKVLARDAVRINLGIEKDGFYADVARMVFVNEAGLAKLYAVLEKCYGQFVAGLRPGMVIGDLAGRIEKLLSKHQMQGYKLDKSYLGHLIGFEIIEHPFLLSNSPEKLRNGMTISLLVRLKKGRSELFIQNVVLIGARSGEILSV